MALLGEDLSFKFILDGDLIIAQYDARVCVDIKSIPTMRNNTKQTNKYLTGGSVDDSTSRVVRRDGIPMSQQARDVMPMSQQAQVV